MNKSERLSAVYDRLDNAYPRIKPYLNYKNSFELLISVIMSAQTTDNQVNEVTPALFERYPSPAALAEAQQTDVEEIIRSTGYYRTKAKNVIAAAAMIQNGFKGEVPREIDDLVSLPGVGRKTANVVRGIWFALPAIIVDTHFSRVTQRLGFTQERDPVRIEHELRKIVPEHMQTRFSMTVNSHGRACCNAKKPMCVECPIGKYCSYYSQDPTI